MFRLPKSEDQQKLIEQYKILGKNNKKVLIPLTTREILVSFSSPVSLSRSQEPGKTYYSLPVPRVPNWEIADL